MRKTFPHGSKFANLSEVKDSVSGSYQEALEWARRECGSGCYRSRGKWLKATDDAGNVIAGECDTWPWDGTLSTLIDAIDQAKFLRASALYIEGGVDYAASLRDFYDCAYDPWVSSWGVTVWQKPQE